MSDYKAAFNAATEDLGAITALLGYARYPGIDLVLRAITDLILAKAEAQALREEVAALRARVVVVPSVMRPDGSFGLLHHFAEGWNECLSELAKLNGKVVSEGLLRRIEQMLQFYFEYLCEEAAEESDIALAAEARDELRALLQP